MLTPCGGEKLATPARADALYTGAYTRACLAVARRIAAAHGGDDACVRILSARHGALPLHQIVAPYETTVGDPDAIDAGVLRAQAVAQGLVGRRVIALGGQRYVGLVRQVWPGAVAPLVDDLPHGRRGIGYQKAWLRQALTVGLPASVLLTGDPSPRDCPDAPVAQLTLLLGAPVPWPA